MDLNWLAGASIVPGGRGGAAIAPLNGWGRGGAFHPTAEESDAEGGGAAGNPAFDN